MAKRKTYIEPVFFVTLRLPLRESTWRHDKAMSAHTEVVAYAVTEEVICDASSVSY